MNKYSSVLLLYFIFAMNSTYAAPPLHVDGLPFRLGTEGAIPKTFEGTWTHQETVPTFRTPSLGIFPRGFLMSIDADDPDLYTSDYQRMERPGKYWVELNTREAIPNPNFLTADPILSLFDIYGNLIVSQDQRGHVRITVELEPGDYILVLSMYPYGVAPQNLFEPGDFDSIHTLNALFQEGNSNLNERFGLLDRPSVEAFYETSGLPVPRDRNRERVLVGAHNVSSLYYLPEPTALPLLFMGLLVLGFVRLSRHSANRA